MSAGSKPGCAPSPSPAPDPVMVLSGGKGAVTSLACLGRDCLVSGHQNGQIQEWSIPIQRTLSSWPGHSDTVLWLAWDDDKLYSQGRDGLVKIWTKSTDQSEHSSWTVVMAIPSAPLIFCNSCIVQSPQGKHLAVPSEETSHINIHTLHLLSSSTPQDDLIIIPAQSKCPSIHLILKPPSVKEYGMCMKMCSVDNGNNSKNTAGSGQLFVGYESGTVACWDVTNGEMVRRLKLHSDSVMALACRLCPLTRTIIGLSASVDATIRCWKISSDGDDDANGCITQDPQSVSVINEGFNAIAVRNDGRIFVTGGWDSRGRVFSLKKLRPLAVLSYHKESINCAIFTPDNDLVLGSKDGYITFWNVYKNT